MTYRCERAEFKPDLPNISHMGTEATEVFDTWYAGGTVAHNATVAHHKS